MIRHFVRRRAALLLVVCASLCAASASQAQTRARGATVTGRVRDPAARPARDAVVALLRATRTAGVEHLERVEGAETMSGPDGRYSLAGTPAGLYCVVVIPTNAQFTPAGQPNRSGFGITYAPNARTLAAARRLAVPSRGVVTANVTLVAAPLAIISGRVLEGDGAPAANATLHVAMGGVLSGLHAMQSSLSADGRFGLVGFPPGTYLLEMREGDWPPADDVLPRVSALKIAIDGRDVTGLVVGPVPLVEIRARVTTADPALRAVLTQSPVRIGARAVDPDDALGPSRPGVIDENGRVEFHAWPGAATLFVTPAVWHITRVRLNGADVTTRLDVVAGQPLDVDIELNAD